MESHKKYKFFDRFWLQESGLSGMLILLVIMHFVIIPLFGNNRFFMIFLNIFWMLFLLAGIFSLAKNRSQAIKIAFIPVMFLACRWVTIFYSGNLILLIDVLLTLCIFCLLITLVLIKVFEPGPVTAYRVIGSVVVYMLMANLWCLMYLFVYEEIGGSFQVTLPPFEMNSLQANFMYFSYITLTTTGFGEIVPLHPLARSLVQIEAIIGVLYPVILIGRLVSDVKYPERKHSV